MVVNVFSVSAFFIVLREVLEACLVVGIVLACLNQSGATSLRKYVYWGAGLGIGVSLLFGLIFGVIYWTSGRELFKGNSEKIFEGIVFLIAAALLTWMILWMARMGKSIKANLENRVEGFVEADGAQGKVGIFLMVFVQVLREGIETWVFLFGVGLSEGGWRGIPIPGILAIVVGVTVAFALFRGFAEVDIWAFFFYSTVLLVMFSAGLVSHAFHELQEAGWFGPWTDDKTLRNWWNARMWSTKACCDDKENQFFALLRALFGYQDTPTFVEWATYFAYWILVTAILIGFNWIAICDARNRTARITRALTGTALAISFVAFIFAVSNPTWNGIFTMTAALLLSILATLAAFDVFALRLRPVGKARRVLALVAGIGMSTLTLFMAAMHIAQMACDDGTQCKLPKFYYLGLIFSQSWASTGRSVDGNSWISIAVLALSLVGVVAIFGTLGFMLLIFSRSIEPDGAFLHDADLVKGEEDVESLKETMTQVAHSVDY